jgi:hypothetical protein
LQLSLNAQVSVLETASDSGAHSNRFFKLWGRGVRIFTENQENSLLIGKAETRIKEGILPPQLGQMTGVEVSGNSFHTNFSQSETELLHYHKIVSL